MCGPCVPALAVLLSLAHGAQAAMRVSRRSSSRTRSGLRTLELRFFFLLSVPPVSLGTISSLTRSLQFLTLPLPPPPLNYYFVLVHGHTAPRLLALTALKAAASPHVQARNLYSRPDDNLDPSK